MSKTYLESCLKDGLLIRWPDTAMPIRVYIAPFRWYEKSKQQESYLYNQMVMEAMSLWSQISENRVRFQLVRTAQESQIDLNWRRVDRKSLGHCEYMFNERAQIYSAEIRIGLSDGVVHGRYNDPDEVRHTILHEFGHALGLLGHSDGPEDIMYVPHQYGVVGLSERDRETLKWLYRLPVGFDYLAVGRKHQLKEPFTLNDVLELLEHGPSKRPPNDFLQKHAPKPMPENPAVLFNQHDILSARGRFLMSTQNIQLPEEIKRQMVQKKLKRPEESP